MPDGDSRYEKIPRKESIDVFVKGMNRHDCVSNVEQLSDEYLSTEEYKDINVILTMSVWNSYTLDAKKMAKDRKVALFTYKEFYGALNYDGDKFLNYRVKKRNQ